MQQFIEFHVPIKGRLLEGPDKLGRHPELHWHEFRRRDNATLPGGANQTNLCRYKISAIKSLCFSHLLPFWLISLFH